MKHPMVNKGNKNNKLKSIESESEEQTEYEEQTTYHSFQCKCNNSHPKSAKKEIVYIAMPTSTQQYDDDPKCKQCKRDFFGNHNEFDLVLNRSHMFQCSEVPKDKYTSRTHDPTVMQIDSNNSHNKTYNTNTNIPKEKSRYNSLGRKIFPHEDEGKINLSSFSYNYRLKHHSSSHSKLSTNDPKNECCQAEHFDIPKEKRELRTEHSQVELFGSQDDKIYENDVKIQNLKKTVISEDRALMSYNKNNSQQSDITIPYLKKTVMSDYSSQNDQIETQQDFQVIYKNDQEEQAETNYMKLRAQGNRLNNNKPGEEENVIEINDDQSNNDNSDSVVLMNKLNSLQMMMNTGDIVINEDDNKNIDGKTGNNEDINVNDTYEKKIITYIYNKPNTVTNNSMTNNNSNYAHEPNTSSTIPSNLNDIINNDTLNNKAQENNTNENLYDKNNSITSEKKIIINSSRKSDSILNDQKKTEILLTNNKLSDLCHNNDNINKDSDYNNNNEQIVSKEINETHLKMGCNNSPVNNLEKNDDQIYTNKTISNSYNKNMKHNEKTKTLILKSESSNELDLFSIISDFNSSLFQNNKQVKTIDKDQDDINIISLFTSDLFKTNNIQTDNNNSTIKTISNAINEINSTSNKLSQPNDFLQSHHSDHASSNHNDIILVKDNKTSTMYQQCNTQSDNNLQEQSDQNSKEEEYTITNKKIILMHQVNNDIIQNTNTSNDDRLLDMTNVRLNNITETNKINQLINNHIENNNINTEINQTIIEKSQDKLTYQENIIMKPEMKTIIYQKKNSNPISDNEQMTTKANLSSNMYQITTNNSQTKETIDINPNQKDILKTRANQRPKNDNKIDNHVQEPTEIQSNSNKNQYNSPNNNDKDIDEIETNENIISNSRAHQELKQKNNTTSNLYEEKDSMTEINYNQFNSPSIINQNVVIIPTSTSTNETKSKPSSDINETNLISPIPNSNIKDNTKIYDNIITNNEEIKVTKMNNQIQTKTILTKDSQPNKNSDSTTNSQTNLYCKDIQTNMLKAKVKNSIMINNKIINDTQYNQIQNPSEITSNDKFTENYSTIHEIQSDIISNENIDNIPKLDKDSKTTNQYTNQKLNNIYESISSNYKPKSNNNKNIQTNSSALQNTNDINNDLNEKYTSNSKEQKLKTKLNALQSNIQKSQVQLTDNNTYGNDLNDNKRLYSKVQLNFDTFNNLYTHTNSNTKCHTKAQSNLIEMGHSKTNSYLFEDLNKESDNHIIISPKNRHKRNDKNDTQYQKQTPIMLRAKGRNHFQNSTSDLLMRSNSNLGTEDKIPMNSSNIRYRNYKDNVLNKNSREDYHSKSKENLISGLKSNIDCFKIETFMNHINKQVTEDDLNYHYVYDKKKYPSQYANSYSNLPVALGKLDLDQLSNIICDNNYSPSQPRSTNLKGRNTTNYIDPISGYRIVNRNIQTDSNIINLKHYSTNPRLFSPSILKLSTKPLSTEETNYKAKSPHSKDNTNSFAIIDLPTYTTHKTKAENDAIIYPPNYIGLYEKLHHNFLLRRMIKGKKKVK